MTPFVKLGLFSFAVSLFISCAGISRNPVFESKDPPRNMAAFTGKISCPDCTLPNLVLKLKSDSTYEAEILDTRTGESIRHKGMYSWKKNKIILSGDTLKMPVNFTIAEKQLIPDNSQNGSFSITSLTRLENSPEELNWKLVELNGKPISSMDSLRYPHFTMRVLTGTIAGNGGCNGFSGHYEILENSIRFSDLISTKMACMEVTYETEFFNALEQADNFLQDNDTLVLRKSDQILARFSL